MVFILSAHAVDFPFYKSSEPADTFGPICDNKKK